MEYILIALVAVFIVKVFKDKKNHTISQNEAKSIDSLSEPEKVDENQEDNIKAYTYQKKCLMTPIEKQFFAAIKDRVGENYVVLPQVNLATVIKKQGDFKFQNELYRNIDFGIFDRDYNILLLIEINDESHNDYRRRDRDSKIKTLISSAGIPLVTFHTKFGVNTEYIAKRLSEHISV